MTRRSAVSKLQRILSYWEGCQLNEKAASEILEQIEKEIGMKPPPRIITNSGGNKDFSYIIIGKADWRAK